MSVIQAVDSLTKLRVTFCYTKIYCHGKFSIEVHDSEVVLA
mgnify:CR=1 FL=1